MGRSCKRPEILQPTRFRRPGDQGRGDRLRQSFPEPRFGARSPGETRRRSPRLNFLSPEELESNAISVYMHQLRKKLGADLLHTVRGLGYYAGPEKG